MAIVHNNSGVMIDVFYRTAVANTPEIYLATAGPGITRYEIPVEPSVPVFLSFTAVATVRRGTRTEPVSSLRVQLETSCGPSAK